MTDVPTADIRLNLVPGLGADERMYAAQRTAFPRLDVPRWLPPCRRETLAGYARRMAELIDPAEPFYLGGASFGGPVALEMARDLRPRAVFLIASFRSPRAIPPMFRGVARLASHAPGPLLRAMHAIASRSTSRFGDLNAEQHAMLTAMMRDADPRFLQWGGDALARWPGVADGEVAVPVHHIHGDADRIIPCRRVRPDVIVPGGGHLLNVTHADAVNAFIAGRVH